MTDPLDELRLRSLGEVSQQLGISPLEVVRLCTLAGIDPESGWAFDPRTVTRLGEVGLIDAPWPHDAQPDAIHRVRAVLAELRARNFQGTSVTRIDNTWRGLPPREQSMLADAFTVLEELWWVQVTHRPEGRFVSLASPPPEPLQAFLDGGEPPESLVTALQEER